jgi:predicted transcriptional regulator
MFETNVLNLISRFVDRASVANSEENVKTCVDDGLASPASAGISHDEAIHMLTTAVVSRADQDELASPNLFQVFIELDRRNTQTAIDILPLLTSAGPLPLAELSICSGGSPAQLLEELRFLVGQGLIEVEGGTPGGPEDLHADRRMVRLTTRGTRRAFR